jgi:DNA-binding IclR family transcriptional regulator
MARMANQPSDSSRRSGLQVVARAADVLRALKDHPSGMTLSELSTTVTLPKSSVHRLVSALEHEGLIANGHRGRIRLGPLLLQLAGASERSLGEELHLAMRRLSGELQETVDLSVLDGNSVRFVAQQPGARRLRAVSSVGSRFPLYCTANGKALLARLPRDEAMELVPERPKPLTEKTITSRRALWEELDQVRETGVAYDCEEHTVGIAAVGAAVHDAFGALAAISVPVPALRFYGHENALSEHLLEVCRPLLVDAAAIGNGR